MAKPLTQVIKELKSIEKRGKKEIAYRKQLPNV